MRGRLVVAITALSALVAPLVPAAEGATDLLASDAFLAGALDVPPGPFDLMVECAGHTTRPPGTRGNALSFVLSLTSSEGSFVTVVTASQLGDPVVRLAVGDLRPEVVLSRQPAGGDVAMGMGIGTELTAAGRLRLGVAGWGAAPSGCTTSLNGAPVDVLTSDAVGDAALAVREDFGGLGAEVAGVAAASLQGVVRRHHTGYLVAFLGDLSNPVSSVAARGPAGERESGRAAFFIQETSGEWTYRIKLDVAAPNLDFPLLLAFTLPR
jgi:hypothetical protein